MFNKKKKAKIKKMLNPEQEQIDGINECAADYRNRDQSYALRLCKLKCSLKGLLEGYNKMNKELELDKLPLVEASLNLNKAQREFVQELIDHFEELEPAADYADRENEV